MVDGVKDKGQRRRDRHRLDRVERRQIDAVEIEPAKAGDFQRIGLAAHLPAGIDLDAQSAIGPLAQIAAHILHGPDRRIVLRMGVCACEQPGQAARAATQRHGSHHTGCASQQAAPIHDPIPAPVAHADMCSCPSVSALKRKLRKTLAPCPAEYNPGRSIRKPPRTL